MNQRYLETVCLEALEQGFDVYIELTIPGKEYTKSVIHKNSSILNELEYYKLNYDYGLARMDNSQIKIVSIKKI